MARSRSVSKTTSTPPEVARQLARGLSTLATTLVNPYSESTDDFDPFYVRLNAGQFLDEAALRAGLSVADRYTLDTRELDPHAFDARGEPYVRVRCWFVGRLGAEWLVGLRTYSTET